MAGSALLKGACASGALFFYLNTAWAAPIDQAWLQKQVDEIQAGYKLIALGAGVLEVGTEPVVAVAGVEAAGSTNLVEPDASWHIGSNTKALTALLYARLVEDGQARWDASVADLFAGTVETIDPAWQEITIEDLFAHRSGIGQVGAIWLVSRHADESPVTEQRMNTTAERLAKPPPGVTGEFEYSNLNYIVAGAAIEAITGLAWEDAMAAWVIEPAGLDQADGWGFGPPQTGPVGHSNFFGLKSPKGRGDGADNPQALGPAGTMHAGIPGHLRLLAEFVDEESDFITVDMREHLLAPWPDETSSYAMGWGVGGRQTLGQVFAHRGSNTMWLSHVELVPREDTVFIINTNMFTDGAREAVSALAKSIEEQIAATED